MIYKKLSQLQIFYEKDKRKTKNIKQKKLKLSKQQKPIYN